MVGALEVGDLDDFDGGGGSGNGDADVFGDGGGGGAGDADVQVSSDTTENEESAEEVEVEKATRAVYKVGEDYPEMPPGGIWVGSVRGCIHRGVGQDTPHAACGYGLKWITARWTNEWPAGVHPLCKRVSCFLA